MWIFCWRSFLLPVIFAAICSRAISSSSDPKIFSPTFGTSWEVGSRVQITWNSSFRLPDGLYYNSHTRLTIRLYEEDGTFVTVIITDYPMSIGYLYWTVPQNTTGNRVLGSNTTAYFLKVYPSFFDWPRSCPGCASKAPHTDLFTIKPGGKFYEFDRCF